MTRVSRAIASIVYALLATSCVEGRTTTDELAQHTQAGWRDVVRLRIEQDRFLSLGESNQSSVLGFGGFGSHAGEYYVLDSFAKKVRVFDGSSGAYVREFGSWGSGPGEFRSPLGFDLDSTGIYVVDPVAGPALSHFSLEGEWLGLVPMNLGSGPISVALDRDLFYVMEFAGTDPRNRARNLVTVVNRDGQTVGQGCRRDSRYLQSRSTRGMISLVDIGRVAARDGLVYCVQPISAVIQILNNSGERVGLVRAAPPFYRPPVDRPSSINQREVFEFLSTWTAHADIFLLPDGFASVYSQFDMRKGEPIYSMFICRKGYSKCGTIEGVGKPLHMPNAETLVTEGEAEPHGSAKLAVYAIRGWVNE